MCPLPRSVKFLGIVAFTLFIGAQYYVYNVLFSQIVNLLKIPSDFISTINVVTISGIVISHLFVWAILSALTYCSFRIFRFNITYSTTFLIVGHIYFISTLYLCITLLLNPESVLSISSLLATNFSLNWIVKMMVTTLASILYLTFLFSTELNVSFTKALVPVVVSFAFLYVVLIPLSYISYTQQKHYLQQLLQHLQH